jgi:selenocysteine-specific elongation factor
VFAARGAGTVVTGTLAGGHLALGDHVAVGPQQRPARVRGIQSLGRTHERIGPGNRVALNLSGIEHTDVVRGDAVVTPAQWHHTRRVDASLHVLAALDHEVTRRGAHVAYVGSGEFPVRVRVLGDDALAPGTDGPVRLHLATPLPLLPGDRFVLRESGRSETVGGGEVLDVAPVRPASRARPDRSIDRVVAERGWITADDLELLTGERRAPTVGAWIAAPGVVDALTTTLRERVASAGELGFDVALLDERERAVLATLDDIEQAAGRARPAKLRDTLAEHPYLAALESMPFAPPGADDVDRGALRQLVQRGLVVERDGVHFAASAIDAAARVAASLLTTRPDGFTVAELRDAIGATRKHALPLAAELDARGITRRRGDLRVAGPRLPQP